MYKNDGLLPQKFTTRPSKDSMNLTIVLAAVCVAAGDRRADFKVQAVSLTGHVGGGDDDQKQLKQTDQDGVSDSDESK